MLRKALAGVAVAAGLGFGGFGATRPSAEARAEGLRAEQLAIWEDPAARRASVEALRRLNPEWDFMRRTFFGLALVDDALAHPERADRDLAVVDGILEGLLADEAGHGQGWFLLPYGASGAWADPAGRSVFVDGELALLAGARRVVADDPAIRAIHRERITRIEAAFAASPAGLPESYPDEAWTFCVTNALAALRVADVVEGSDHTALFAAWVSRARRDHLEPGSGLLGSSYHADGRVKDGPEGSSVWLAATNLLLVDPAFARDQYARARDALVTGPPGFAWSREWGAGWEGPQDIDSGPVVPILEASPSASGFAILAAKAFGDTATSAALNRSLGVADLVVGLHPDLAEMADNPMGDVIVLHGLTFGPLWARVGAPPPRETVGSAFPPPLGAERVPSDAFGASLRDLALRDPASPVLTHDGAVVGHRARVIALPLVPGDLQQCADSAIRLRAEWLRRQDLPITFHATSGDPMPWARWLRGERPFSTGAGLAWRPGPPSAGDDADFDAYLAAVFRWAGTRSLALDTVPADAPRAGDLLVDPGSPGHAVVLLDVAAAGDRTWVLVGEGYMPAQSFHVELGPDAGWWPWDGGVALDHWTLAASGLRRWADTRPAAG